MEEHGQQPHIIDRLGGPTKVAALLRLRGKGAVQRVSNWKTRGIPPSVVLANPEIFSQIRPEEIGGGERVAHG